MMNNPEQDYNMFIYYAFLSKYFCDENMKWVIKWANRRQDNG